MVLPDVTEREVQLDLTVVPDKTARQDSPDLREMLESLALLEREE